MRLKIGERVESKKFGPGTIKGYKNYGDLMYAVEFDKKHVAFHNCNGLTTKGFGLWCTDDKNHYCEDEIIKPIEKLVLEGEKIGKLHYKFTLDKNIDYINVSENRMFIKLKKDVLDEIEKRYLTKVITPFKEKVYCIEKCVFGYNEGIVIAFADGGRMYFPQFKACSMYAGMEVNRMYSLEELGL